MYVVKDESWLNTVVNLVLPGSMPHQQGREHPPFVFSSSATFAFEVGSSTGALGVILTHEAIVGED
jgi:hypothetical protein